MDLENLRGWMAGEDCCVVGCGPSAQSSGGTLHAEFDAFRLSVAIGTCWSMACNRAVGFGHHDFAVCVEPSKDGIWAIA